MAVPQHAGRPAHRSFVAKSNGGGKVAKKLGDGLMALFGHPVAQENDSERAVRACGAIDPARPRRAEPQK